MRPIAFTFILLATFVACRGGSSEPRSDRPLSSERTTSAGPTVVMLDSVRLEESDSGFIGSASGFAVDAEGEIFVADAYSARVLEFTPRGDFVRAYGSKGSGPGELERPISLMPIGDTLMAVGNTGKNSPLVFDRRTGEWLTSGASSGYVKSGQAVGDSLWLGVLSQKRGTSLATWLIGADSMHYFGPVPDEYIQSTRLASIMPHGPFVVWDDTVAVGFAGVNHVFITDGAGGVMDTINPPVARRRGVPANLMDEYATEKGVEYYTQLASLLMQIGRMGDGRLMLIHHDVRQDGDRFSATAYLSLVSSDHTLACVDAIVSLSPDATPMTAIRGDQLVTFEQATDGRDAASWVKTYRIDDSTCDWVPAG